MGAIMHRADNTTTARARPAYMEGEVTMHPYVIPASVKERVIRRMGKLLARDTIEGKRTALLVVDMQNYFCAEGFPAEVPLARAIVPNINSIARAIRAAGGIVVWIQTTSAGGQAYWARFHANMLSPARRKTRLAGLDESSKGFELFQGLDVLPDDLRVKKIKYSAFAPNSSNLDGQLRSSGIDTVLVAGALTNVCCESTARDAMMYDYNVVMVSDANATLIDEEHAATLNTFMMFFGDVMSTEEAISRVVPFGSRKAIGARENDDARSDGGVIGV
jgi:ureidoacrylate peracid hydrolase